MRLLATVYPFLFSNFLQNLKNMKITLDSSSWRRELAKRYDATTPQT
jgi:hypothetical protein